MFVNINKAKKKTLKVDIDKIKNIIYKLFISLLILIDL